MDGSINEWFEFRPVVPGFDWQSLRFPGEAELRSESDSRPGLFSELQKRSDSVQIGATMYGGWAGAGVIVRPQTSPLLCRVAESLRRTLALASPFELRVFPAAAMVAELVCQPNESGARLCVSSAAVERLWTKELLFFLGRKLGRLFFGHWPLPMDPTTGIEVPNADELLLRGLWKFQELSCDRVGLICCQDERAASLSLLKAATGLPGELLSGQIPAPPIPRGAEEQVIIGDDTDAFTLLRLAAIQTFALSSGFAAAFAPDQCGAIESRAVQHTRGEHPETAPVAPIPILSVHPNSVAGVAAVPDTGTPAKLGALRGEILSRGVCWLLSARPRPGDAQLEAAAELLGADGLERVLEQLSAGGESLTGEFFHAAGMLAEAPSDERRGLLSELLHVAAADGTLGTAESNIISRQAASLGLSNDDVAVLACEYVDPEFADYRFTSGEPVEVHLDGQWIVGSILRVEPTGDLRVRFGDDDDTLRLSPRVDLIRPLAAVRRAG